jgi:acyl-CoA dehydrogenase
LETKERLGMSDDENMVVEAADRIFRDFADSQTIINSRNENWKEPLWAALAGSGLPLMWVPEPYGGSGASLMDGFGVLRAAGRSAIAMPLAETMLAGWLLSIAGIVSSDMPMTVVPAGEIDRIGIDRDGRLTGRARRIPFAGDVSHLAVVTSSSDGHSIALVEAKDCHIFPGRNLAGDAADEVVFARTKPVAVAKAPVGFSETSLLLIGSASRSQQIAGALEAMLDTTVRYSTERIAFEKPISKYQAVQHNLARLAGEAAAAVSAAGSAADAIASGVDGEDGVFLEVAAAKIRCGEAAEKGAAIAHQVHGAIGFTAEHVLHRLTLRALAWRDDFGSESYWAAELGKLVGKRGADELWPLIASR